MVRINDEGNEEEFSFPAATKEQVCIKHYYDKNRMYSNATYYKSEEECCDLCKYVYENKDNVLGYSCKNKGDFPINPYCVCDEFIER